MNTFNELKSKFNNGFLSAQAGNYPLSIQDAISKALLDYRVDGNSRPTYTKEGVTFDCRNQINLKYIPISTANHLDSNRIETGLFDVEYEFIPHFTTYGINCLFGIIDPGGSFALIYDTAGSYKFQYGLNTLTIDPGITTPNVPIKFSTDFANNTIRFGTNSYTIENYAGNAVRLNFGIIGAVHNAGFYDGREFDFCYLKIKKSQYTRCYLPIHEYNAYICDVGTEYNRYSITTSFARVVPLDLIRKNMNFVGDDDIIPQLPITIIGSSSITTLVPIPHPLRHLESKTEYYDVISYKDRKITKEIACVQLTGRESFTFASDSISFPITDYNGGAYDSNYYSINDNKANVIIENNICTITHDGFTAINDYINFFTEKYNDGEPVEIYYSIEKTIEDWNPLGIHVQQDTTAININNSIPVKGSILYSARTILTTPNTIFYGNANSLKDIFNNKSAKNKIEFVSGQSITLVSNDVYNFILVPITHHIESIIVENVFSDNIVDLYATDFTVNFSEYQKYKYILYYYEFARPTEDNIVITIQEGAKPTSNDIYNGVFPRDPYSQTLASFTKSTITTSTDKTLTLDSQNRNACIIIPENKSINAITINNIRIYEKDSKSLLPIANTNAWINLTSNIKIRKRIIDNVAYIYWAYQGVANDEITFNIS